jgi:hypothetical protein
MKTVILLLLLLLLLTSCSDVQRVCPTGNERAYMAVAVEYWASQGEAVMLAADSECTIRTRIKEEPYPGEQWGDELAIHHVYNIGVDLEPSHLVQTEIRIRASMWEAMPHLQRIYVSAHELGHAWYRGHSGIHPMAENQKSAVIKQWLTDSGMQQYIDERNMPE